MKLINLLIIFSMFLALISCNKIQRNINKHPENKSIGSLVYQKKYLSL